MTEVIVIMTMISDSGNDIVNASDSNTCNNNNNDNVMEVTVFKDDESDNDNITRVCTEEIHGDGDVKIHGVSLCCLEAQVFFSKTEKHGHVRKQHLVGPLPNTRCYCVLLSNMAMLLRPIVKRLHSTSHRRIGMLHNSDLDLCLQASSTSYLLPSVWCSWCAPMA